MYKRPMELRDAMTRRLQRRVQASGQIRVPAVPGMLEEYVTMCDTAFASMGARFSPEELVHLRGVLESVLGQAYAGSQRSDIVISYNFPVGMTLNYTIKAESPSVDAVYENWLNTREPPLFGTEPDARVLALAGLTLQPREFRVLDIGAGTGRNALALARRGHPVDAVEMTPKFAATIRAEAAEQQLDVRVIERDVFATADDLRADYQLMVLSEVVSDFRSVAELRGVFELAARQLAPGGQLVFNIFLARHGYLPDDAARELGQQTYSTIFTRRELAYATTGLPLELLDDDSVHDYEQAHLPPGAWPQTSWYPDWVRGLDIFDVEPDVCPVTMRWLVYRKSSTPGGTL